jgi:hypothetical protein
MVTGSAKWQLSVLVGFYSHWPLMAGRLNTLCLE